MKSINYLICKINSIDKTNQKIDCENNYIGYKFKYTQVAEFYNLSLPCVKKLYLDNQQEYCFTSQNKRDEFENDQKFDKQSSIEYKLKQPFRPEEIKTRIGTNGITLFYADARVYQERLDQVIGIDGGETKYKNEQVGVQNGNPIYSIYCTLTLNIYNKKVSKTDCAEITSLDAIKGGASDAFKRACVQFGIGRFLYNKDGIAEHIHQNAAKHTETTQISTNQAKTSYPTTPATIKIDDAFETKEISNNQPISGITIINEIIKMKNGNHNTPNFKENLIKIKTLIENKTKLPLTKSQMTPESIQALLKEHNI